MEVNTYTRRSGPLTVRTVLLSGVRDDGRNISKVAATRLWRVRKRLNDPRWVERIRKQARAWRKANPEKLKAQLQRYRKKHKAELRAYQREYYRKNEKRRLYMHMKYLEAKKKCLMEKQS